MDTQSHGGRWPSVIRDHRHLVILGLAVFLLVYLSSFTQGYGYFIDEFYYIACAYHPAFGYVDHPPLAPLLLTGERTYVIHCTSGR